MWLAFLIIGRPIWSILIVCGKFIFNHCIVRFYRFYRFLIYKLGWSHFHKKTVLFVFSRKPIHVTMALLTVILVFHNLVGETSAQSSTTISVKEPTILDTLIYNEFATAEENQLVEEFFDQEVYVSPAQWSYLDNLASVRPQMAVIPGANNIKEDIPVNNEKPEDVPLVIPVRTQIIHYTVRQGDTVSTIANAFGISVSTILWENDLTAYSVIRPGDDLVILPQTGVRHTVAKGETLGKIATKYGVDPEEIIKVNGMGSADKIGVGKKIIIPGAKKRIDAIASTPLRQQRTGIDAIMDIVKPNNAVVVPGNKMQWPTEGHRITQYYSVSHRAIDVANKVGTPLYAADAGVVEYAGWGTGYGNEVVIDHGGGKKTRYAHASALYVKKGERVEKGETIAAMGSTGWSTGPHIHFEVIINNIKYNPLNYIK